MALVWLRSHFSIVQTAVDHASGLLELFHCIGQRFSLRNEGVISVCVHVRACVCVCVCMCVCVKEIREREREHFVQTELLEVKLLGETIV